MFSFLISLIIKHQKMKMSSLPYIFLIKMITKHMGNTQEAWGCVKHDGNEIRSFALLSKMPSLSARELCQFICHLISGYAGVSYVAIHGYLCLRIRLGNI